MGYVNAARIAMSRSGKSSSSSTNGILFFTAAALGVVAVLEGLLLLKPRVMCMRAEEEGGIFSKEEDSRAPDSRTEMQGKRSSAKDEEREKADKKEEVEKK